MMPPPIQPLPPVMTTTEVAAVLRCEEKTVERYVHEHELDAIQIGRERRFRAEDVLEFIATRPTTRRDREGRSRAPVARHRTTSRSQHDERICDP